MMNSRNMSRVVLLFTVVLLGIFAIACGTQPTAPAGSPAAGGGLVKAGMTALSFNVGVSTEPGEAKPNQPVKLTFNVQDSTGKALGNSDLEIVHEKPMHLLIVSDD